MEPLKLLIVEDDIALGDSVNDILQGRGHEIILIRDGKAAWDWLDNNVPDCVVLDMHLPNVSGIQILDKIRATDRLAQVKVLAVTADALIPRLIENKADATFSKPFSAVQLANIISRLTGQH
jgi:DNA-binding response OmpR family regulator